MPSRSMPLLLPDRRGYALGDEVINDFTDRPELPQAARERIARWRERFGGGASAAGASGSTQLRATELHGPDLDLARGLVADRQELQELHLSGLLDDVDEARRGLVAQPQTHPNLPGARYPLSSGALATLADVSEDQVRRWADQRLLPSFRVGVERRFGRAAVARALLLADATKPEKAVLSAISAGQGRRALLLIGALLEDALARDALARNERGSMARALRAAADRLEPTSAPAEQPQTPKRRKAVPKTGRHAVKRANASVLQVTAEDQQWKVLDARSHEVFAAHRTQREALQVARDIVRNQGGGEIQVHGRTGLRKQRVAAVRRSERA